MRCNGHFNGGLLLVLLAAAGPAGAYDESFTAGLNGWQDRAPAAGMLVAPDGEAGRPGGCLKSTFAAQGVPVSEIDAVVATGQLATAGATGDYRAAGLALLGFDFRAQEVQPSALLLRLYDGNGAQVFRGLPVAGLALQTWHSLAVSLRTPALGGWAGNTSQFESILTNVARVEIQFTRNGTSAQTYLVDNVYLAPLPAASAIAGAGTSGVQATWVALRTSQVYRVERSASGAPDDWAPWRTLTATGAIHHAVDDPAQPAARYRIVLD